MMNQAQNTILDGSIIAKLRIGLKDIFVEERVAPPKDAPQGSLIFYGKLLMRDVEAVYTLIAERWRPLDYTPLLRGGKHQVEVVAMPGTIEPKPSNPLINLVMFIITLALVILFGSFHAGVDPTEDPANLIKGIPFAAAIMAILLAHEFGHYFLARYHKVSVTLPYFIPFPTLLGTLGAVILYRSAPITRKQYFDIGVAGPLAGLVVAIPVLIFGLLNSTVEPLPSDGQSYMMEGNSILYWSVKYLIFGQALPADGLDVFLHPVAFAGWAGLLITFLNLIPVGQLDGGHILYVLLGSRTKFVGYVIIGFMLILGIFVSSNWLIWAVMVFALVGVGHPPPLNELAPLDSGRRALGYLMILVFLLLLTPEPIQFVGGP